MPVKSPDQIILDTAAELIKHKQDSELAKALKSNDKLKALSDKIKKLEEMHSSQWGDILKEEARLKLEIDFIIKDKSLDQIEKIVNNITEEYAKQQKASEQKFNLLNKKVHPLELDNLKRQLVIYGLALNLAKNKQAQAVEQARFARLNQFFEPLLTPFFRDWATNPDSFNKDKESQKLIQGIKSNEPLVKLKDYVIDLIKARKEYKKENKGTASLLNILDQLTLPHSETIRSRFENLKKAKKRLNLELYPIFGKRIDALENYIQALKEEGVDANDMSEPLLKSDRAKKLRLAEKLKNDLIAFENKIEVDRQKDININLEALNNLIKENEKATGSVYLHGKGKLDKILKGVREEIDFSINKNNNEKLKADHLKTAEKRAIKKAMLPDSNHPFREELIELKNFIAEAKVHLDATGLHSHTRGDMKIAKELRSLLLDAQDLSDTKLDLLSSRLQNHMDALKKAKAKSERYARDKDLVTTSTSGRNGTSLPVCLYHIEVKLKKVNSKKLKPK